jgi:hypothetical protein
MTSTHAHANPAQRPPTWADQQLAALRAHLPGWVT